jgi:hypothetical protein
MRVLFPDNTGSAVTVTNNYALLINNQTANTGTVTYTNRFGIYQEGASDTNYFAATTLVGTNVNSGYKFEVSGSANATTLFQNGVQVLTTASISGTTNFISKFTSASAIGNSQIFDNGTSVGINTTSPTEKLQINGSNAGLLITGTTNTSGLKLSVREDGQDVQMLNLASGGGLRFYVNAGSEAMRIFSDGNVGINTGSTNAGFKLDVNGTSRSGTLTINTNGQGRVFSTYYGSGSDGVNIFIGGGGLSSGTGGGASFLGSYNSAMGVNALFYNTTGYSNSAMGWSALFNNTTGYFNSAMGMSALDSNTTGYKNSAMGVIAGYYTNAGGTNQTSNNSVYLGYDTRASASGNTNEIVIGSDARGEGSNTIRLGNTSINAVKTSGSITTGAPSTGTAAAWKFGERVASAGVTFNNSQYIQLDVNGTAYYLATVNLS